MDSLSRYRVLALLRTTDIDDVSPRIHDYLAVPQAIIRLTVSTDLKLVVYRHKSSFKTVNTSMHRRIINTSQNHQHIAKSSMYRDFITFQR